MLCTVMSSVPCEWRRAAFKLKGEDEEWTSDAEAMPDAAETTTPPGVNKSPARKGSDEAASPAATPTSTADSGGAPAGGDETHATPRLRLNTSLATDPALRPLATAVGPSDSSDGAISPSPTPTSEYLATLPPAIQTALATGRLFRLPPAALGLGVDSAPTTVPPPRPPSEPVIEPSPRLVTVPVYMCTPCGIKFSSLSTLEAHQTYYCSHRKSSSDVEETKSVSGADSNSMGPIADDTPQETPAKVAKTGKQYACSHCSYSADKKVSLNRHMRMHSVSPSVQQTVPNVGTTNGDASVEVVAQNSQIQDRYCADCDIRFSSTKTFRAHKLHYCSTRHIVKPPMGASAPTSLPQAKTASSCTSGSAPASPSDGAACRTPPSPPQNVNSNQQFLALPTNPVLIVPYSLFRNASVLAGPSVAGLPSSDSPCFLLPNGTIQPMSQAIPPSLITSVSRTTATPEVLKAANKPRDIPPPKDPSAPLDLSVRRTPELRDLVIELGDEHEKENRHRRSPTPEQIVCAPSLPGSPPLTPSPRQRSSPSLSTSPKRKYHESRSNSPRQSRSTPKSNSDGDSIQHSPDNKTPSVSLIPPTGLPYPVPLPFLQKWMTPEIALRLASELPVVALQQSPQVLVKQGVSKCKECNIVFCKHENYVAHKKHYCSARLQEDEGSTSKNTGSPPISPTNSNGKVSPTGHTAQYQQLICVACGIKFTSLDNLNAHQAYYCLKRNELQSKITDSDIRRCLKCKGVLEQGHQCAVNVTQTGGWKCPCCDVVSSTASAAQRHMDTHSGVKAYRCTICRYKGNTLRGMRTHIRMHFEKKTADLQEENFITCILEDDSTVRQTENNKVSTLPSSIIPSSIPSDVDAASPSSDSSNNRNERFHYCDLCTYSSSSRGNVVRHYKLIHNNGGRVSSASAVGEGDELLLCNGVAQTQSTKSMPVLETTEDTVVVKQETSDVEVEVDVTSPVDEDIVKKEDLVHIEVKPDLISDVSIADDDKKATRYCKSCDISFNYHSTFIAHKKFYCSSHTGEMTVAGAASNNNNTPPNTRTAEASVL